MKESLVDVAVLIIFFNRPWCLEKTFDSIKKARPSKLYLYQDGPRNDSDLNGIKACQEIISKIDWKCEIRTFFQKKNMGVDPSEYIAIRWAFSFEEKCIIIEDDDAASPSFFPFCKALLDKYQNDERVGEISGLTFNEKSQFYSDYDYVFTHFGCIWGWATWRRVVQQWDPQYRWLDNPSSIKVIKTRYGKNAEQIIQMAKQKRQSKIAYYEIINGINCTLHGYLNICPTRNMIHNVGLLSGAHTEVNDLDVLPAFTRKVYTMPTYDVAFPLRDTPNYIIDKRQEKFSQYRPGIWAKSLTFIRCIFKGKANLVIQKIRMHNAKRAKR
jgi:hypothetical protein